MEIETNLEANRLLRLPNQTVGSDEIHYFSARWLESEAISRIVLKSNDGSERDVEYDTKYLIGIALNPQHQRCVMIARLSPNLISPISYDSRRISWPPRYTRTFKD